MCSYWLGLIAADDVTVSRIGRSDANVVGVGRYQSEPIAANSSRTPVKHCTCCELRHWHTGVSCLYMHTSRVLSALLVGLGVALIAGGLTAPRFLHGDGRLPLSVGEATWTISDPEGTRDGKPAPVVRQLHMELRDPSNDDVVSVRVGDTLRAGDAGRDFDNLMNASTWAFTMHRVTGAIPLPAKAQLVMAMPDVDIPIDGVWLKFPSDVQQQSYDVFDPVLRGSSPAVFTGEEEIAGRTIYRFQQDIPPANVAVRYADAKNTQTIVGPEGEQIRAFYYHAVRRELMVDQVSGLVVGISEAVDDYYGDVDGKGLRNIVTYDGTMDPAQVEERVADLALVYSDADSQVATRIVLGVGVAFTVIGLLGVLIGGRGRRRRSRR